MQHALSFRPIASALVGLAMLASAWANSADAQSIEEIDQLVRSSEEPAGGLALARTQVAAGSLLEALATLDRSLAVDPKNKQARLLHANILCLIDDRVGASVEFGQLRAKDYSKSQWAAALGSCTNSRDSEERGQ
jgi:Flp pilus assembly protein TadD